MVIQRPQIYTAFFLLAALNALARPGMEAIQEAGFVDALLSGFGSGFVIWVVLFIALERFWLSEPREITHWDRWFLVLGAVALLLPASMISWLILALIAGKLALLPQSKGVRPALWLLFAAGLREPIVALAFKLYGGGILAADTALTGYVLSLFFWSPEIDGNILTGPQGQQLLIISGCSSLANASIALLGWLALSLGMRERRTSWDVWLGLGVMVAVVLLNAVRLAIMSLSAEHYEFMHGPNGGLIFDVLVLVAIAGFTWLGLKREQNS